MVLKNKKKFLKIVKDIKNIKIQGARNVAGYALYAYLLSPTAEAITILKKSRPTEPMLINVLEKLKKIMTSYLHIVIQQMLLNL